MVDTKKEVLRSGRSREAILVEEVGLKGREGEAVSWGFPDNPPPTYLETIHGHFLLGLGKGNSFRSVSMRPDLYVSPR